MALSRALLFAGASVVRHVLEQRPNA